MEERESYLSKKDKLFIIMKIFLILKYGLKTILE